MKVDLIPVIQEFSNIYFAKFLTALAEHHANVTGGLEFYKVILLEPGIWRLSWKTAGTNSVFRQVLQQQAGKWVTVSINSDSFLSSSFSTYTILRGMVETMLLSGVDEINCIF